MKNIKKFNEHSFKDYIEAEIVDEVINRVNEYGDEYIEQLETLNSGFPVTKYKKVEPTTHRNIEVPKGVKVKSTGDWGSR